MIRVMAFLLCVAALRAPAFAQEGEDASQIKYCLDHRFLEPPELPGGNAAIQWCKLWVRLSDRQFGMFSDFRYEYKLGTPLTEPNRKFLEANQQFLDQAAAIAAMPQCDWGLRSTGPSDERPVDVHLSYLCPVERILVMDAQRCLEQGRISASVDRLISALRCGRHFAGSGHVSAVLVGGRICSESCGSFEYLLKQGKLDVAQSRRIVGVLREYPFLDPFGIAPAWRRQAQFTAKFFRTSSAGDHPMLRLLGAGRWTKPRTMVFPMGYASALTPDQCERDIQRFEAYYELASKALVGPNSEACLRELQEEAAEGQHGITVALISPAIDYVLSIEPSFRKSLRCTIAKLVAHINEVDERGSK
jgi:hypothetical protein